MEQALVKAVDEAEAEAALLALLALAEPLVWQDFGIYVIAFCKGFNTHGVSNYKISPRPSEPEDKRIAIMVQRPCASVNGPGFFRTVADAKAACERHHATGRWD